jgi:hypothetical protein
LHWPPSTVPRVSRYSRINPTSTRRIGAPAAHSIRRSAARGDDACLRSGELILCPPRGLGPVPASRRSTPVSRRRGWRLGPRPRCVNLGGRGERRPARLPGGPDAHGSAAPRPRLGVRPRTLASRPGSRAKRTVPSGVPRGAVRWFGRVGSPCRTAPARRGPPPKPVRRNVFDAGSLRGQPGPMLRPPASEDGPPGSRPHPGAEPVALLPTALVGLERLLHGSPWSKGSRDFAAPGRPNTRHGERISIRKRRPWYRLGRRPRPDTGPRRKTCQKERQKAPCHSHPGRARAILARTSRGLQASTPGASGLVTSPQKLFPQLWKGSVE